jgi:hypothetical protein
MKRFLLYTIGLLPWGLLAQPEPGEVFREYVWAPSVGPAVDFLRIGDPLRWPDSLDLEHIDRAELVVEKQRSSAGPAAVAVQWNEGEWQALPEPAAIPVPRHERPHLHNAVVPIEVKTLQPRGNTFRFRIDSTHLQQESPHRIYGAILRLYYKPRRKAGARGEILLPHAGDALREDVQLVADLTGPAVRIEYLAKYRDVNWAGDGTEYRWQYFFHRGEIRNVVATTDNLLKSEFWDTRWIPDQEQPLELAARIHSADGLIYFTEAVTDLRLERDFSVDVVFPRNPPTRWNTRNGRFSATLPVPGNPATATAARLYWASWSPCHCAGMFLNGVEVYRGEDDPCYEYVQHEVALPVAILRPGPNQLVTAKTPPRDDAEDYGMEVLYPGPTLKIRYGEPVSPPKELFQRAPDRIFYTVIDTVVSERFPPPEVELASAASPAPDSATAAPPPAVAAPPAAAEAEKAPPAVAENPAPGEVTTGTDRPLSPPPVEQANSVAPPPATRTVEDATTARPDSLPAAVADNDGPEARQRGATAPARQRAFSAPPQAPAVATDGPPVTGAKTTGEPPAAGTVPDPDPATVAARPAREPAVADSAVAERPASPSRPTTTPPAAQPEPPIVTARPPTDQELPAAATRPRRNRRPPRAVVPSRGSAHSQRSYAGLYVKERVRSPFQKAMLLGDAVWQDHQVELNAKLLIPPAEHWLPGSEPLPYFALATHLSGEPAVAPGDSLGATAEFYVLPEQEAYLWRIVRDQQVLAEKMSNYPALQLGQDYEVRFRAEAKGREVLYRVKCWPEGSPEPPGWDLQAREFGPVSIGGYALLLPEEQSISFASVEVNPVVNAVRIEQTEDEGQPAFRIETPGATYLYQAEAGGFSSILDRNGNDWVDFHADSVAGYPAAAAHAYRGLPNLVFGGPNDGAGHPGFRGCTSVQIDASRIRTTTRDGRWQWTWTFFDHYAELEIERVDPDQAYWFLYEGPPAGRWDPQAAFWYTDRGAMPTDSLPDYYAGTSRVDEFRWAAFGQSYYDQIFYVAQRHPDTQPDLGGYLGSTSAGLAAPDGMVVFGFGRGPNADPRLRQPERFVIGFTDLLPYAKVKRVIEERLR